LQEGCDAVCWNDRKPS